MKIERAKNAVRNVEYGMLRKFIQILFPFLTRTVMIYTLGDSFLGLNSLFTSVLRVLNLAELGVGSAMVYSMYEPIVRDDTERICALVRLYRSYYRLIGAVVAVAGIAVTPALPMVIVQAEVPEGISIQILYWMNLAATVLSYWLFSYKNSLLLAFQRTDISSRIAIGVDILQSVVQLAVLILLRNYYIFLAVAILSQIVNNLVTAFVVGRLYPAYLPKGRLPGEEVRTINHRIADLFTSKVGAVIVGDADTIVISAFLGLRMLAVYQNYYSILTSVLSLMDILLTACVAGIGNSLITEGTEKNYRDLRILTFLVMWLGCLCSSMLLVLYQPFMVIWMGKGRLLPFGAVVLLCVYFFILTLERMLTTFKDAGGIWHKDRFRPLISALLNLTLNLIFIRFLGIYGVIASTILAMITVGIPWLLHNLFHELFRPEDLFSYTGRFLMDAVVVVLVTAAVYGICNLLPESGLTAFAAKTILCFLISNGLLLVLWGRRKEFGMCLELFRNTRRRKM